MYALYAPPPAISPPEPAPSTPLPPDIVEIVCAAARYQRGMSQARVQTWLRAMLNLHATGGLAVQRSTLATIASSAIAGIRYLEGDESGSVPLGNALRTAGYSLGLSLIWWVLFATGLFAAAGWGRLVLGW